MRQRSLVFWVLIATVLLASGMTLEAQGQPLRLKITTVKNLGSGREGVYGCDFTDTAVPVGNITVNLGRWIKVTTGNVVSDYANYGVARVVIEPDEYGFSAFLKDSAGKIQSVYLEGEHIAMTPGGYPTIRKTSFGDYVLNITYGGAFQPVGDPTHEWDYWLAIELCFSEVGQGPAINSVTMPRSMRLGEQNPYQVGFSDPDGDVTKLSIETLVFNPFSNEWVSLNTEDFDAAARGAQGKTSGSISITSVCNVLTQKGDVKLQIKQRYLLFDAAGHVSDPYEVAFECLPAGAAPSPGKGATQKWTGTWNTDAFGQVNLYQQEGNKVAGSAQGGAAPQAAGDGSQQEVLLFGEVSEDGSTLKGTWHRGPSFAPPNDAGDLKLSIAADGSSFSGQYSPANSGRWSSINGTKEGGTEPPPPPGPGPGPGPQPPPTGGAAPRIVSLNVPSQLVINAPTPWTLSFSDPQGDVVEIQFEWFNGSAWQVVDAWDPQVQGQTQGTLELQTTCRGLGAVANRVTLVDAAGNRSSATEFTYQCVSASAPPPSRNQPPRAPTLLGPPDQSSQLDPSSIRFQWQDNGDPDGDALGFYINVFQFDFLSGEWVLVFESAIDDTSVALEGFEPNAFYAWRVFATDWAQRSDPWYSESDLFTFDTLLGFGTVENPPSESPGEDQSAPPAAPAPSASVESALDANRNGVLDDAEIRQAIQHWILGQTVPGTDQTIDDLTIRRLIQLWILGQPLGVASATQAQRLTLPNGLMVQAIQLSAPSLLERALHVQGQGIAAVELQMFDLQGRLVLREQDSGSILRFSLLNDQGRPLANGVYLYVVGVQDLDGKRWRSDVRKLMVLR